MSDSQDELRKRFNERSPGQESESQEPTGETGDQDDTAQLSETDTTGNSQQMHETGSAGNSKQRSNMDKTRDADNTSNTRSTEADEQRSKPGPDPSDDATRDRRQVPMYLSDSTADELNQLYQRLDGMSKLAGEGGIEKHKDFMETVAQLAMDSEDEIAERLDIETDHR